METKKSTIKKTSPKKKASKPNMLISFILDETGSMDIIKDVTISGFNEYVNTLKSNPDAKDAKFTLTKFNSTRTEIVHDGIPLNDVALLTNETYKPSNTTPLYDAIGRTVSAIESKIGKNKTNVLFVIQTDGFENDSHEFKREDIFDLVTKKKLEGWTFVFIGADIDSYAASSSIGISIGNTATYAGSNSVKAMRGVANITNTYVANVTKSKTGSYISDTLVEDEEDKSWQKKQ